MTKIIAEAGWNFISDRGLAKQMIEAAADAGANYFKTQTFSVDTLKPGPWDTDGRREIYKKASVADGDFSFFKLTCAENNIEFITSCFNTKNIEHIAAVCNTIKIPSPEITNVEMLQEINKHFGRKYIGEVFVSTGASTLREIEDCLTILSDCNITLLHCVSNYPCPLDKANLYRINVLRALCKNVGYSGHCEGIYDAIAALDFNVSVIEKHFTINRDLPGRDNKFAILPDELKFLCSYIKNKEKMLIPRGVDYQKCEQEFRDNYRLRWQS